MIKSPFNVPDKSQPSINDEPYLKPQLTMIVGHCGSGKTTLLLNLLNHLQSVHDWSEVLFCTGSNRDPMLKAIEAPITTNPSDLGVWMTQVKQPDDEPKYNLLVLDDVIGAPEWNIFANRSDFTSFILNHRHYGEVEKRGKKKGGTWVIMVAQRLSSSFSPTVKQQVNIWYFFYPKASTEVKQIEKEGDDPVRIKKALQLLKAEGQHKFLTINKNFNPYLYMIGWDKPIDFD